MKEKKTTLKKPKNYNVRFMYVQLARLAYRRQQKRTKNNKKQFSYKLMLSKSLNKIKYYLRQYQYAYFNPKKNSYKKARKNINFSKRTIKYIITTKRKKPTIIKFKKISKACKQIQKQIRIKKLHMKEIKSVENEAIQKRKEEQRALRYYIDKQEKRQQHQNDRIVMKREKKRTTKLGGNQVVHLNYAADKNPTFNLFKKTLKYG
jgi:hypothetical protein